MKEKNAIFIANSKNAQHLGQKDIYIIQMNKYATSKKEGLCIATAFGYLVFDKISEGIFKLSGIETEINPDTMALKPLFNKTGEYVADEYLITTELFGEDVAKYPKTAEYLAKRQAIHSNSDDNIDQTFGE